MAKRVFKICFLCEDSVICEKKMACQYCQKAYEYTM